MAMLGSDSGLRNTLETVIDLHGQAEKAKYVALAGSTLLVYDWLLNLDLEIAYIWKRPWSIGRAVYHFNRVWPIIIFGSVLPKTLFGSPSPLPATCKRLVFLFAYGQVIGWGAVWSVFLMRAWALYNKRRMLWALLFAYICTMTYTFVVVTILAHRNTYFINPLTQVFTGCAIIFPNGIWIIYIVPVAWEWTVFGLTIWKIWNLQESYGITPLMHRLAENGIAYFIVLHMLFLFSCIGGSIDRIKIASVGSGFITAASSIVCGRVILSLHEFEDRRRQPQQENGLIVNNSVPKLATAIPMSEFTCPVEDPGASRSATAI